MSSSLLWSDLPTGRLLFMLISVMGSIPFAPLSFANSAEVRDRESLKGIVGIEVVVDTLNIEIEDRGLPTAQLQHDIQQRLQKAGMRVLTESERLRSPKTAMLVVRVDARHDRIGRYFYSIDLLMMQRVRLDGSPSELSAVTWMKPGGIGIIADDNVQYLKEQVLHNVDQLIQEYAAVNPSRQTRY
jgi:hypothetical protein